MPDVSRPRARPNGRKGSDWPSTYGNSGNTSGPHIHIHHQRQDPSVFPAGFAEGLPLFFRDHDGPPMPIGGLKKINGRPVWSGQRIRHNGNGSK